MLLPWPEVPESVHSETRLLPAFGSCSNLFTTNLIICESVQRFAITLKWELLSLRARTRHISGHATRFFLLRCRSRGSLGQWRRQGGRGEASPLWVDVQKLCNMIVCAFIVMELLRITRQIHCKAVEQRATLIHRQYSRDLGTSYSRPPLDPYLTSAPVTKSWRRHCSGGRFTAHD